MNYENDFFIFLSSFSICLDFISITALQIINANYISYYFLSMRYVKKLQTTFNFLLGLCYDAITFLILCSKMSNDRILQLNNENFLKLVLSFFLDSYFISAYWSKSIVLISNVFKLKS